MFCAASMSNHARCSTSVQSALLPHAESQSYAYSTAYMHVSSLPLDLGSLAARSSLGIVERSIRAFLVRFWVFGCFS